MWVWCRRKTSWTCRRSFLYIRFGAPECRSLGWDANGIQISETCFPPNISITIVKLLHSARDPQTWSQPPSLMFVVKQKAFPSSLFSLFRHISITNPVPHIRPRRSHVVFLCRSQFSCGSQVYLISAWPDQLARLEPETSTRGLSAWISVESCRVRQLKSRQGNMSKLHRRHRDVAERHSRIVAAPCG